MDRSGTAGAAPVGDDFSAAAGSVLDMRTLAITQNITLDGSIEMLGDWFDPADQDPQLLEATRRQSEHVDAMLLGRQTFEDFRGYWPQQTDDQTGITDELNQIHKYVVSSTMTDPQWRNSTVLTGDWIARVRDLKGQQGRDIVVTGSITLTHALIVAGLVDEYRLFVYPTVQGRGRRLFPDGYEMPRLQLAQARGFENGVSLLRYTV
jgi:dihydrofolate reductase